MRRALIGLIMAATGLTPVAAQAQENARGVDSAEQFERRPDTRLQRREARQQRQEVRQQRQEVRAQRAERAEERSGGARGEAQRSDVARQRSGGARGDVQRSDRSRQVRQERAATRRGLHVERARQNASQSAWQGDPNDPRRERYERLERRNQQRYGTPSTDSHDSHDGDRGRGEHREVHRDLRGEHRELHRSDPTNREHRQWHRGAERDHRQIHRGEHRDLHAGNPTRREHRRWHGEWDRSWRSDRRYDWSSWRYRNRHHYRLSPYYSPYRDWSYRRFSIGFHLQPLFYSQRYWISDPWQYRLPPAPPGTRWVRYYDDVLLVDTWSGQVIDVIYNFFW